MKKPMISLALLIPLFLIAPHCKGAENEASTEAPDFSTYEARRAWLLRGLKDIELRRSGWHDAPIAFARLWNNPHDQYALNFLTNMLDHKSAGIADIFMMAHALCTRPQPGTLRGLYD